MASAGKVRCWLTIAIGLVLLIGKSAFSQQKQGLPRVAVLLEAGFNGDEFWRPMLIWQAYGIEPRVFSINGGDIPCGNTGAPPATNTGSLKQLKTARWDLIYIPGGKSPEVLMKSSEVVNLIKDLHTKGQQFASICHGPLVFAKAGILKDKPTAYLFHAEEFIPTEILPGSLGNYQDQPVVFNGNILMSRYPDDAEVFATAVLQKLGMAKLNHAASQQVIYQIGRPQTALGRYAAKVLGSQNIGHSVVQLGHKLPPDHARKVIWHIPYQDQVAATKLWQDTILRFAKDQPTTRLVVTHLPSISLIGQSNNCAIVPVANELAVMRKVWDLDLTTNLGEQTVVAPHRLQLTAGATMYIGLAEGASAYELEQCKYIAEQAGYSVNVFGTNGVAKTLEGSTITVAPAASVKPTLTDVILYLGGKGDLPLVTSASANKVIYLGKAVVKIPKPQSALVVSVATSEQLKWSLPSHLRYQNRPYYLNLDREGNVTAITVANTAQLFPLLRDLSATREQLTEQAVYAGPLVLGLRSSGSGPFAQIGIGKLELAGISLKNPHKLFMPVLMLYNSSGQLWLSTQFSWKDSKVELLPNGDQRVTLNATFHWQQEGPHPAYQFHPVSISAARLEQIMSSSSALDKLFTRYPRATEAIAQARAAWIIWQQWKPRGLRVAEDKLKAWNKQSAKLRSLLTAQDPELEIKRDAHGFLFPARAGDGKLPAYLLNYRQPFVEPADNQLKWVWTVKRISSTATPLAPQYSLEHYVTTSVPVHSIRFMGSLELGGNTAGLTIVSPRYRGLGAAEVSLQSPANEPFNTADIWPAPYRKGSWLPTWQGGVYYAKQDSAAWAARSAANLITMPRGHGVSWFDFQAKGDMVLTLARKDSIGDFRSLTEVFPGDSVVCQVDEEFFAKGEASQSAPLVYNLYQATGLGSKPHLYRTLWRKLDHDFRHKNGVPPSPVMPAVGFNWDYFKPGQSYATAADNLTKAVPMLQKQGVKLVLNHNAGWLNGQSARLGMDGHDTANYLGTGTCNVYDYSPLPGMKTSWPKMHRAMSKAGIKYMAWITAMSKLDGGLASEFGKSSDNWAMERWQQPLSVYDLDMAKWMPIGDFTKLLDGRLAALDALGTHDGYWFDSSHNLWHSGLQFQRKGKPGVWHSSAGWTSTWSRWRKQGHDSNAANAKLLMAEGHTQYGLSCSIETDNWQQQPWYLGHTVKWLRNGEHKSYSADSLATLGFKLLACGGWLTFDILEYNSMGPYVNPNSIMPNFKELATLWQQLQPYMQGSPTFLPDDAGVRWGDNGPVFYFNALAKGGTQTVPGRVLYQRGRLLVLLPKVYDRPQR